MSWSTLTLTYPLWLLLLPLPVVIYRFVPAYKTKQSAIKVPFFNKLLDILGEQPELGASQLQPSWWQRGILIVSWCLLVIAMTKPTVLGEPQTREKLGRDVMVAVDLSGSMSEMDFSSSDGQAVSRLDAVKSVLHEFVATREGDRLGLILFGDAAYLQTPFTADHDVWLALLDQTEVAMAGQSTHLGDAIGLAIKVFEQSESSKDKEKVVVVLTDGNDTGSFVEPKDAAIVAAAKGVRIHVIAMGDPATIGEQALDMATIDNIASQSGGQAFQALDQEALQQAYQTIGELEPKLYESTQYRPKQTVHQYLLMVVVILYLIAFSTATLRRRYGQARELNETNQTGRNI
ncbi:vWA domain-containing protein [Vibrio mediterranei]|uniref:Aerotolerance regulator BatA n=1 Tax=Vibrio mediterranei TaxID=689 RepID=A0ABX5DGM6_9VIBR|nr:VWA domain-containing protein [Vibrio mediterranei]PCD88208.1 aerotolerance regulator BatA [Vibrio mediterranei]PRQ68890.1 aerotolerance regulator BatA [Vibrio mediterranei]